MMQQQAQMAASPQQMSGEPGQQPMTENLGGQGFNPAAGGIPPVQGVNGQGEV